MKAAPFEYSRPADIDEACSMLAADENARVIAGGQTLVPMMAMRLARPTRLIDINRIVGLSYIRADGDAVAIGATTRQCDLERDALVARDLPLLAKAIPWIGHAATRARGTIGGSLANADPHGDLPAVFLALDGEVTAEGPGGQRTISAADLFVDYLQTSLSADEILTAVRVPKAARSAYVKFNRRAQDWAIVGAAAVIEGGSARIALTGVASTPVRASAAEAAFSGANSAEAAEHAADGLDPPSDTAASGEYRAHLTKVLVRRALDAALAR
jgi:carbon-monoxide dehydrogenase medium subunit